MKKALSFQANRTDGGIFYTIDQFLWNGKIIKHLSCIIESGFFLAFRDLLSHNDLHY